LAAEEITPTVQDNLIGQNEMLFENELYDSIQRSCSVETKVSIFVKTTIFVSTSFARCRKEVLLASRTKLAEIKIAFCQKWKLLF